MAGYLWKSYPFTSSSVFNLKGVDFHGTKQTTSCITSSDYPHRVRPADRLCHSTAHDCVPGGADSRFSHQHSHHCLLAAEVKELTLMRFPTSQKPTSLSSVVVSLFLVGVICS